MFVEWGLAFVRSRKYSFYVMVYHVKLWDNQLSINVLYVSQEVN